MASCTSFNDHGMILGMANNTWTMDDSWMESYGLWAWGVSDVIAGVTSLREWRHCLCEPGVWVTSPLVHINNDVTHRPLLSIHESLTQWRHSPSDLTSFTPQVDIRNDVTHPATSLRDWRHILCQPGAWMTSGHWVSDVIRWVTSLCEWRHILCERGVWVTSFGEWRHCVSDVISYVNVECEWRHCMSDVRWVGEWRHWVSSEVRWDEWVRWGDVIAYRRCRPRESSSPPRPWWGWRLWAAWWAWVRPLICVRLRSCRTSWTSPWYRWTSRLICRSLCDSLYTTQHNCVNTTTSK